MNSFVLGWFLLWFLYHGILNLVLIPNGFSFRKKGLVVSTFALLSVCFVYQFYGLNSKLSGWELLIPTILASIYHLSLLPLNRLLAKSVPRTKSPLLPRYFDVLFQQLMIASLTIYSESTFWHNFPLVVGVIFMTGHLPILFFRRVNQWWKVFIIVFGFFGGVLFSFLFNRFGAVVPIILHITLYYILAIRTPDEDSIFP